jgi:DNA processing protein
MTASATTDRAALIALAHLPGVGPATILEAHRTIGGAAAWRGIVAVGGRGTPALPPLLAATVAKDDRCGGRLRALARDLDPNGLLDRHLEAGIEVATLGEPGYPARLAEDPSPPALLFLRGDPSALATATVAIVGTRNATRLGRETAAELAGELVGLGISIVSGLALGIDGAAHAAVLAEAVSSTRRGRPIAVVANGLDIAYPRRHRHLQQLVAEQGVVVSETPLGGSPLRWRFPARNRIIAGLADAVVVVESRSVGGSMSTAAEALARDVPLLAVPGHPTSPAAAGSLDLIADGAIPVRDVEDVLVALGLGGLRGPSERSRGGGADAAPPEGAAGRVVAVLDEGPRSFAEVLDVVGGSPAELSVALASLEARGLVARHGLWYERQGRGGRARR